ncbi:MAG: hypothetical protein V5789_14605 [Colwellia sp.]
MTQLRIKLLILSIIFIACLTAINLNLSDGASVADFPNIAFTSSETRTLKSPVKAKEINTTPTGNG